MVRYEIISGTYEIISGTYEILCGTYEIISGTYEINKWYVRDNYTVTKNFRRRLNALPYC